MATRMMAGQDVWTYSRYLTLDDGIRYEVLEGELIMVPAQDTSHQRISKYLGVLLFERVERRGKGEVFDAPIDVVLSEETVCQPDLLVVLTEHRAIVRDKAIMGVPDVVVEIVSPSSVYADTRRKMAIYRDCGMREYWLVYPVEQVIDIHTLVNGQYSLASHAQSTGAVHSPLLDEEFPLDEIFHFQPSPFKSRESIKSRET